MARQLTDTYLAAMDAPVRRPVLQVLVYPDGEEQDISGDVIGWRCERHYAHRGGTATLTVANPQGRYQIGAALPRGGWLAPGTGVVLRMGLATAAGVELVPVFTGVVATAEASYQRGEGETLLVQLLDRTGEALQREVYTGRYADTPVNEIITQLFTGYCRPVPPLALQPTSTRVPSLQFVADTLMDAGHLVAEAAQKRLFFDAEGVLRTAPLALPTAPSWSYPDGRAVIAVREAWDAPAATCCLVTGRTLSGERQVGEEVLWQTATVTGYEWGAMVNIAFAPRDAVYEDIRLEVEGTLAPFEQVVLFCTDAKGIVVKVISPTGRRITLNCYGKQVFYTTPNVTGQAEDDALMARFGLMLQEHANTAIADPITATVVAAHRLDVARWRRHTVTVRLLAHPGIEPGDVLRLTHPRTGQALLLLADTVTQCSRRGEEWTAVAGLDITA
jgi:hypothetical protein